LRERYTYLGILCIACASLIAEILLTRISSVISWYHLAFFVISLAMLGMTAGAIWVFLRREAFEAEAVPRQLARYCGLFAILTPVAMALAMSMPLLPVSGLMEFFGLLAFGGLLALPFVAAGVVLTLALTRAGLSPALAYGVDLVGAALGCALVIPLLAFADAPSGILVAAALGAAGGLCFARAAEIRWPRYALLTIGLAGLAMANRAPHGDFSPLRPAWVKGLHEERNNIQWVAWNTYSRVTVDKDISLPPISWGESRLTPAPLKAPLTQRTIKIDGAAATMMAAEGNALDKHEYLDWDITSFAHRIRPRGPAAVIGVGGGRDLLAAARSGHESVVGVELNQLIVDLHEGEMRSFSRLMDVPGVELVSDEARSWFARTDRRFSVLAMSLIDTWASTGAGAYSLSENGLYTVDAWNIFVSRLEEDGIFTVSRWWHPDSPGETGRMCAVAFELLWRRGVEDPSQHLILLQTGQVATLLLSPTPFSKADLDLMQKEAIARGFNMLATPRKVPRIELLAELWGQKDSASLRAWADAQVLDLSPATDDRPFFFNMLRPGDWLKDRAEVDKLDVAFLGNLQATLTLVYATLVSILLTLVTIFLPLRRMSGLLPPIGRAELIAAGGYFALIGLGFMFVEIGLLSRLNVMLGHPTLSLAILLGGIILFTGLGSLLSEKLPFDQSVRLRRWYPLIPFAMASLGALASGPALSGLAGAGTMTRVLGGLAVVALPALGMGLGFPLGLRLVARFGDDASRPALGPWLWGINGACGVCASGLALGCSMVWGIPVTLAIGAACYLCLLACTHKLAVD
jgi:hypothetical protein